MYLVYTASKDTYITNKIVSITERATDANVGTASTLDLFKLYDEITFSGETTPIELSRALIKFNLQDISSSITSKTSFDDSSFRCFIKLHDMQGKQLSPANFNLVLFPLSMSFDEGKGRDVSTFGYLDRANWLTSSFISDNITWNSPGAMASGTMGSSTIDLIETATIGGTSTYLVKSQNFIKGYEDLSMNITNIVSASMCGIIPNHGFLIAYSGSEEHDDQSRFVKRFASRHTRNPYIRPKLIVQYNDSILDNNKQCEFNVTGSVFLNSYSRGTKANLISGSSSSQITGHNSLLLKIHTSSYQKYFTGSQYYSSGMPSIGIYSASFAIDRYLSASVTPTETLGDFATASGSITFGQEWLSLDETISYFTGSLMVSNQNNSIGQTVLKNRIEFSNTAKQYRQTDLPKISMFIVDLALEQAAVRTPVRLPSKILNQAYYRIRDAYNGQVLTPFIKERNITRISSNNKEMFFYPSLKHLPAGKTYTFDVLVVENEIETIYESKCVFMVV